MADKKPSSWRDIFAGRRNVVRYVRSPLGFYVLALLIIEAFLLGAGTLFSLPENIRVGALGVGVLLFIGVVTTVTVLVMKFPTGLVFSEESHLQWESMQLYGDNINPITGPVLMSKPGSEPPNKPEQSNIKKSDGGL
jgi:hypothetical protein